MADELRLWAINIDEFRECFAAPPDLAGRLRQITDRMTPDSGTKKGGLLSKLGPLMRRPIDAPVILPDVPNRVDGEALITGRYVDSDRLSACWRLVNGWLDELGLAHTTIELPKDKIDELEFDLVRAEVTTQVSIRRLWGRALDIPLRCPEKMSIGYMESTTVAYLVEQWTTALPELEEDTVQFATPLLEFLSQFPELATIADAESRRGPDLIAWWTAR